MTRAGRDGFSGGSSEGIAIEPDGRPARASIAGRWVPALTHRRYRVYWAGTLFSGSATRMFGLSTAWLVYEMAKPPLNAAFMLGVLGFCRTIPMLAFALPGGVAADVAGNRRMLLVTIAVLTTVSVALALLASAGLLTIWLLLGGAFLAGTATAFHLPSNQAFVRELVTESDVQNAVALMAVMQTGLRIGAPLLAGVLLATGGGGLALTVVAACYATMFILLTLLDAPPTASAAHTSVLSSMAEGFHYIRSDRLVAGLLLVTAIPGLFALPYVTVMPIFADAVYGRGVGGLGVMESMAGLGALTGAVTLTVLSGIQRRGVLLMSGIAAFGCALIVFALVELWPLALVMLIVIGLSDMLYIVTVNGMLLTRAPAHLRGRVMSVVMLADVGMSPLGSIVMGAVAGVVGAQAALAASGSVTVALITGVAARFPRMRRA
jgi:MFS transporter, DHA1 family, staphyloferrin A biosynthesis exporter